MTKDELAKIKSSDFGLPKKRMYPIHDKNHVMKAIQLFHHCPEKDREELARNIERKAKKYGIRVSKNSTIAKYLGENSTLLKEDEEQLPQDRGTAIENFPASELLEISQRIDECKRIWINSDYHLEQINNLKALVESHNSHVSQNDCFIHLGDLVSDDYNEYLRNEGYKTLQKLNGRVKILIRGNNDVLSDEFYLTHCGFHYVLIALKYKNFIFTHMPLKNELIQAGERNIHGHLHEKNFAKIYTPQNHTKIYTKAENYKPVLLDPTMNKFKAEQLILQNLVEYTLFDDADNIDLFDTNNTVDDSMVHSMRMSLNLEELNLMALGDEKKLRQFNEKVERLNELFRYI